MKGDCVMLLTFDVGNTNITVGGFDEDRLVFTARIASNSDFTEDQYAATVSSVLLLHGVTIGEGDECIVCSVVPMITEMLGKALRMLTGKAPMTVGPGVKTGLNIKIDNPAQLGADLVAGAVGALAKYPMPCAVVDLGTATTVCALDGTGAFLGGAIAAGVRSTLAALSSGTAQLPGVGIERPKSVIGTNTAECMRSGLIVGAAAMIDGLVDRMEDELGMPFATVVATGGLAPDVIPCCKRDITVDNDLLLDGLRVIYLKNKS